MSTFVLVHGAWHGAWCWYRVIPRLEAAGHRVIAPDLPGLGADKTPIGDVTLKRWVDAVVECLDLAAEPVVLVGHSRAGIIISEAAEARPEMIRSLVYLTAFLLEDGQALLQVSSLDTDTLLVGSLVIAHDQLSATVREDVIDPAFYGGCDEEHRTLSRLLLEPEPLVPLATPIHVTPERFGRVERVYIECLQDRAIGPSMQKRMYDASPCGLVITMDTDHSPFFSAPDELVAHLLSI